MRSVADWFRRLPTAVLAALVVVGLVGVVAAGIFAYRTWDYIEHDNEFCLSCHLMVDPFERFARSAHRDLGCKACHQPTFTARSTMALTQILENPEELQAHAEVPSQACISCHVEGDPEKWTLIARSVGHRVHLESEDESLEGLECVQCHSSGVHEFTATDQTCGQAGCHENTDIQLGKMADLTIHCVACHDFNRPVSDTLPVRMASVGEGLRPQASECLSCHQMRLLVGELPDDEPHGGVCGACHNPHEQATPAEAVQSCASAGCHFRPDTLTPFHRGLDGGRLQQCTACHSAHDSHIENTTCTACHQDMMQAPVQRTARPGPAPGDTLVFSHSRHRTLECTRCHTSDAEHGAVTVQTFRECQACHHDPQAATVTCTRCHTRQEIRGEQHRVAQRLTLTTGATSRQLPFAHARHETVECTRCHTRGLTMSTADLDCASCHRDHHRPDAVCSSCHTSGEGAHTLAVHTGCGGSGCHQAVPFTQRPNTREFCLACHRDMRQHERGQVCTACHAVPQVADLSRAAGRRQ